MSQPTLTKYLNEVSKKKRLTFEEEKTATPSQLVECNLRLPVFAARRWSKSAEELMDRIQDGNVGLIIAAERFDPSFGVHFATFAMHHINNQIRNASRVADRIVTTPQRAYQAFKKATTLKKSGLPYEVIATQLGITTEEIAHLFDFGSQSIDADPSLVDAWLVEENKDIISVYSKAKRTLSDKEFKLFSLNLDGYTLEELAPKFGVSRSRIGQMREVIIRKLQGIHYERN